MIDANIKNIVNIVIDIYNIIICLFIIFSLFNSINKKEKTSLYFAISSLCCFFYSLGDIVNWTCEGAGSNLKHYLLTYGTCVFYVSHSLIFLFFIKYLLAYIQPKKEKIYLYITYSITLPYALLSILSLKFDFFFNITKDNYYQRGALYNISLILLGLSFLYCALILIFNSKIITKIQKVSFYSFIIMPGIGQIFQIFFYGYSFVNVGITFSLLLIFINLHRNLETRLLTTEEQIQKNEEFINQFQDNTILSLANLVENRDTAKGNHINKVVDFATLLAKKAQEENVYPDLITDSFIQTLIRTVPLHDIGKIVVPDKILKKEGKLSVTEFELMKKHVIEAKTIVNEVIGFTDNKEYIDFVVNIATYHHERWDGMGYPYGLKKEEIPLCARIMAIVDVFDAIVSNRYYKDAVPFDEALQAIKDNSGKAFDPILTNLFLSLKDDLYKVYKKYGE